ncbi:MAG: preprotein translocase subunit SecG [Pseudomonadota bacterium]
METVLITVHYLICFFLIVVILLQVGKGADIGAVFGGASQTVFGGRGPATFLSKMTAGMAIAFLVTSIWLAQISKTRSVQTVIDKAMPAQSEPAAPLGETPKESE